MSDYSYAIEVEGLTKKYDGFTLDNITFNVEKGSVMGFIGQNGAGKTTTINALLNVIKKDSGNIKMLGLDNLESEYEIKEQIGVIFDEMPFHESFNARQLNVMFSGLYGSWDEKKYFEYLERFGLPLKKKLGKFSKGMKMKIQIATALSHGARLLIMDEATSGLDPVVRNEILDIFREYIQDENNTILMSSHITSDLEKIADSITFIDKGRIFLSGYKDEILEKHGVARCTKVDFEKMDKDDYVSARKNDFGIDVMTDDRDNMAKKYPGMVIDRTTLEEIMLFYVNRGKKEWV